MRLYELRGHVANICNYDPEVTAYKTEIDRLINSALNELYDGRLWNFAQREVRLVAHEDRTATDGTVTNGSSTVTTAANFFTTDMPGMFLEGPDGVEYEILKRSSATSVELTSDYTGTTVAGTAQITVKHRYIDLPTDCVKVLQLGRRPLSAETTPTPGRFVPLARTEGEWWDLPLNETGDPEAWVPFDDAFVQAPIKAPVLAAVAGAWPAGTYEFRYVYVKQGRYSAMSPSASITLTAAQSPNVTYPNTGTDSGIFKQLYLRYGDFKDWRRITVSDVAETTTTVNYATAPSDATEFTPRHPGNDGAVQRVALYPRQSTEMELTLRYLARPMFLVEDGDTPTMPASEHQYLVDRALWDIFIKHDQPTYAKLYEQKARGGLLRLEQRYLSTEARRWVKGGFDAEPLYRRNPYGPLTNT